MTDSPTPERRPGEWPVPRAEPPAGPDDDARHAANAERARWELTLGSIRADLEAQPSTRSIRAAARRWATAITHIADDIIRGRQ